MPLKTKGLLLMKRIAMLLLIATELVTVASAANWIMLGQSQDETTTLYMDFDSVQRKGDVASVWIKLADKKGGYSLQHDQFRRDTRQDRILRAISYDEAGTVRNSHDSGENAPWVDIAPESLAEAVYEAIFKP